MPSVQRTAALWSALGVGVAALVVYALTLYPDVPGGDSGELIAAVSSGGVIHPPGYPLYALLGGLFAHLPMGSVAWRLNLFSALCDAVAAALLTLAVARWAKQWWAGVAAGLLFAFSPGVWKYAVCAEVFALNNLLAATLFLLAVLYAEKQDRRLASFGALVFGLGLSNHHTIVFTALPVLVWALWIGRRELLQPRMLLRLGLFFALGLLPYVWLPIAASRHAAVSWGEPRTWAGFWTHLLRREYGTFQLAGQQVATDTGVGNGLLAWGRYLNEQVGPWGIVLALVGLMGALRTSRGLALVTLGAVLLSVFVLATLAQLPLDRPLLVEVLARFWQQPELFVVAWCGVGLAFLSRYRFVPALALAWGVLQFGLHASAMNRHGNTIVRQYGAEILRPLPPNTLLITKGDLITNTVRYLQVAEHLRPDVRVVDQEILTFPWAGRWMAQRSPDVSIPGDHYGADGFSMKQFLDANSSRFPIVVCGGFKEGDTSTDGRYQRWPFGICESIRPSSEPVDVENWFRESEAALPRIEFAQQAHPPGSWEQVVWDDYWEARQRRGYQLITLAIQNGNRPEYFERAAKLLEGIVHENEQAPPTAYKNLGIAYSRLGLETPEQRKRVVEAWSHYLRTAPPSDRDLPAIQQAISDLSH